MTDDLSDFASDLRALSSSMHRVADAAERLSRVLATDAGTREAVGRAPDDGVLFAPREGKWVRVDWERMGDNWRGFLCEVCGSSATHRRGDFDFRCGAHVPEVS